MVILASCGKYSLSRLWIPLKSLATHFLCDEIYFGTFIYSLRFFLKSQLEKSSFNSGCRANPMSGRRERDMYGVFFSEVSTFVIED